MAIYTVTITSEDDLNESWTDSSAPNFLWKFDQEELGDCVQIGDGQWQATYESMEVTSPATYTYIHSTTGARTTYILGIGEYGIKP